MTWWMMAATVSGVILVAMVVAYPTTILNAIVNLLGGCHDRTRDTYARWLLRMRSTRARMRFTLHMQSGRHDD